MKIRAVLMDIDGNQVIVSIGNHPLPNSCVRIAMADPAPAKDVAAGTMLVVKTGWTNGNSIATAAAGEVYLCNGVNWIKLG